MGYTNDMTEQVSAFVHIHRNSTHSKTSNLIVAFECRISECNNVPLAKTTMFIIVQRFLENQSIVLQASKFVINLSDRGTLETF